ncbi:MAG: helix-turn-helix transcriptional regulator [Clostridia bacterium]|nr:helix-turn-helix transcriptional regulator [Clostridia bacterium]
MARINRCELTKLEIIRVATRNFIEKGYDKTQVRAIAKELGMSPGNLTFHYPSKEHMLAELVNMLCKFQWELLEAEVEDGLSSVMAICLEIATIAATCDENEAAKDFFISSYTSPMCLSIIRKNDVIRAKKVFKEYCSKWDEEDYAEAGIVVSGIEYATFVNTGENVSLEMRISGAINCILAIYNVPKEIRKSKADKVLSMDYRSIGRKILSDFKKYVNESNEQALLSLLRGYGD